MLSCGVPCCNPSPCSPVCTPCPAGAAGGAGGRQLRHADGAAGGRPGARGGGGAARRQPAKPQVRAASSAAAPTPGRSSSVGVLAVHGCGCGWVCAGSSAAPAAACRVLPALQEHGKLPRRRRCAHARICSRITRFHVHTHGAPPRAGRCCWAGTTSWARWWPPPSPSWCARPAAPPGLLQTRPAQHEAAAHSPSSQCSAGTLFGRG